MTSPELRTPPSALPPSTQRLQPHHFIALRRRKDTFKALATAASNPDLSSPPQGADKHIKMPDGRSLLECAEDADIKALLQ